VLAELGLLRAVTSDALQQRVDGLGMIRRALELRPGEARYHFYLARSLAETFRCSHAGAGPRAAGEADACAEAIRSYHRAAELATADDYWSQHIRRWAPHRSLEIFHRYARREGDILTAALNMSLEERTRELEYLVPREAYRDRSGAHDYPQFWLATLYHFAGDLENAERWIRELLGPDKASWPDGGPWRELYARILEERGPGSERAARNESCPAPCP
jgi:tetratricopeptide (TPR) repeat protein